MRIHKLVTATLAAAVLVAGAGRALASTVLYEGIGLISGQQSITDSFSVAGPGTLTVTLQDMAFPMPLASLNMLVSSSQSLMGPESGPGTESFQVTSAQQVYVQALATAEGPLNTGVYGLDVMWKPANPVPLSTSIAFLGSGLLLLAWHRRQRRAQEASAR